MRHIPDGVLRRLDDEPLAIPDRVSDHVAGCPRCSARRAEIASDTERAVQQFAAPQLVPDLDQAWAGLRRELERPAAEGGRARRPAPVAARRARVPRVSLRAGMAIGAVGVVIAGTAAAATLTTVFSPTHVAPVTVSQSELRAIARFTGLGGQPLGAFATPQGSTRLRFGTITWSTGLAQPVSTPEQAAAQAGFPVTLPTRLPRGVGAIQRLTFQPTLKASVTFNASASTLAGSSVTIDAGPGVVAQYVAASGPAAPVLFVATMRSPTARTTGGASLSQVEAFLLRQPGIPSQLADEIRLLGDLRTILPVPVPPGASVRSVQIGGWPGLLVTDSSSNALAGVVWEDGQGLLHVVGGLLNSQDVLNVAGQLR